MLPNTCLQVELKFFHEHEAQGVEFYVFCGESERESQSAEANYRNRKREAKDFEKV